MDMRSNLAESLISKFALLKNRSVAVVKQLSNQDIKWSPNEESNTIANLALHIRETVRHRVESIFFGSQENRNRDKEFDSSLVLSKDEVIASFVETFDILIQVIEGLSEHVGQIFYIAKARISDQYVTTTFPKKKN